MNLESKNSICYTIIRKTRGRDVVIGISFLQRRRQAKMELKEQLNKICEDLEKLERKKEKFLEEYDEKKKKISAKKKELEQKIKKEKDEKILRAVQESFGEINEKNMDTFLELLKKNSEEFSLEMEIASENLEETNSKKEEDVPNFGTTQTTESNPYSFSGSEV